ncbi:MAG: hypothetical protein A2418_00080 [Candidatus Brennerbacteria bacterium RIFOXYC1_FULL_41_11]|nr:MAG: hypothetical protein A2418_00080 [Candidatus Brennerbacteria bacterium RIFOXYC1_FULL_41_11]
MAAQRAVVTDGSHQGAAVFSVLPRIALLYNKLINSLIYCFLMKSFDIISIGTATFDAYLRGYQNLEIKKNGFGLQCFPLGAKIEVRDLNFSSGGGATNTAFTFAKQGLKTGCVFEIGRDEFGRLILQEQKKQKITVFPFLNKKIATALSIILIDNFGERTIFVFRGASGSLNLKEALLSKIRAKWVYLVPGAMKINDVEKIITHFKKQKTKIALNPSKSLIQQGLKKLSKVLKQTDVLLLNQEEAAYLTGLLYKEEQKIFRKLDQCVPGILVMTEGPKGLKVSDGSHVWRANTFKEKKVVDRSGAGDAFGSGFVAGLIQKNEQCQKGVCSVDNISYAIRLGSANATLMVETLGVKTGILSKKEFASSPRWKNLEIKIEKI